MTTSSAVRRLSLDLLKAGLPGVTSALGTAHAEACMVCFSDQAHVSGVMLTLNNLAGCQHVPIDWDGQVTPQIARAHADLQDATEAGACGIAFLLVLEFTDYTIVERSYKTTGFDYWAGFEEDDDEVSIHARLEVSGIIHSSSNSVFSGRVNKKIEQTKVSDNLGFPAYIIVVDFGEPRAHMEER